MTQSWARPEDIQEAIRSSMRERDQALATFRSKGGKPVRIKDGVVEGTSVLYVGGMRKAAVEGLDLAEAAKVLRSYAAAGRTATFVAQNRYECLSDGAFGKAVEKAIHLTHHGARELAEKAVDRARGMFDSGFEHGPIEPTFASVVAAGARRYARKLVRHQAVVRVTDGKTIEERVVEGYGLDERLAAVDAMDRLIAEIGVSNEVVHVDVGANRFDPDQLRDVVVFYEEEKASKIGAGPHDEYLKWVVYYISDTGVLVVVRTFDERRQANSFIKQENSTYNNHLKIISRFNLEKYQEHEKLKTQHLNEEEKASAKKTYEHIAKVAKTTIFDGHIFSKTGNTCKGKKHADDKSKLKSTETSLIAELDGQKFTKTGKGRYSFSSDDGRVTVSITTNKYSAVGSKHVLTFIMSFKPAEKVKEEPTADDKTKKKTNEANIDLNYSATGELFNKIVNGLRERGFERMGGPLVAPFAAANNQIRRLGHGLNQEPGNIVRQVGFHLPPENGDIKVKEFLGSLGLTMETSHRWRKQEGDELIVVEVSSKGDNTLIVFQLSNRPKILPSRISEGKIDAKIEAAIEAKYPMPPEIQRLVNLCNSDLFDGPLYLDDDGESVTHMEGKPFDFSGSCSKINEWLEDNVPRGGWFDVQSEEFTDVNPELNYDAGEVDQDTGEEEFPFSWEDWYHVKDVWKYLVGKELYQHVR